MAKNRGRLLTGAAMTAAGVAALAGWKGLRTRPGSVLPPPVRAEPRTLATPDGEVRYYETGSGTTVLLLHSFNAAGTAYELRPLFERLGAGRRAVAVDWLGFGLSARPERPYDPEVYLRVLRHLLEALAPEPADVVALSLPCQYVAKLAAEEPARFRRLALISPTGFGRFGGGPGTVGGMIYAVLRAPWLGQAFYTALTVRPAIRYFLRQIFADPKRLNASYERYAWATTRREGAVHAPLAFVTNRLELADAEETYRRVAVPTLMLFGDHPRFSDPGAARALVAANRALRMETLTDCGDLPQWERPEETAQSIKRFLSSTSAS